MAHRRRKNYRQMSFASRRGVGAFLRRPAVQIFILLVVAVIVYLIALGGGMTSRSREVTIDEAYQKYQAGAYFLDVRTQKEWDEYHAPNTTFIPLDQLSARMSELPRDKEIVILCSAAACSQQARDILLSSGFSQVVSVSGGMDEWYLKGYPIEGAPPQ